MTPSHRAALQLGLTLAAAVLTGCGAASGGGTGPGGGGGGGGPTNLATGRLNDTGVPASLCFEAGSDVPVTCGSAGALALSPAQDGMVGRDATLATAGSADGRLGFSFSAVAGGCVLDEVTGLLWESKTTDGGLRDRNRSYSNLTPLSPTYGVATDASGYVAAVNATGLCGASDWRLPTADELQGLLDYGVLVGAGATVDTTWFPITQAGKFWSSTGSASVASQAWLVDFATAAVQPLARTFSFYVRLVRSGPPPVAPGLTVSSDGQEVTDARTTLIWRRCPEGMTWNGSTCAGVASYSTQEAALRLAVSEAARTGVAWRLPNVKELASIADRSQAAPAIDALVFPATPAETVAAFWTSTPYRQDPRIGFFVNFNNGYAGFSVGSAYLRASGAYVRLVRGGP